jgi:hypothetical protein
MTNRSAVVIAWLLPFLWNVGAAAHHAFSPVYDSTRTVTIKGTLIDFKLVNPHATMTVDVVDANGTRETWTVELAGLLSLSRAGWTDKTVSAGDQLTITGNPTHTSSPRIAFRSLVLPSGRELLDPGDDRRETIEEQRRERARQRDQAK